MNINNAILHVLDFESCANVFAQTPLSLANKTAKRYVTSQAKRTLSNMDRRRGTFEEGSSFEEQLRAYLRGERDFVGLSTDIAQFLARELGSMEKTPSTDVLVVDFTGDAVCEALRPRERGRRSSVLCRHLAGEPSGLHARGGLERFRRRGHHRRPPSRHPAEPFPEGGVVCAG